MSPVELVQVVIIITYVLMATPADKEQPQSSGLSSSTVLDALNDDVDLECQDTDSDIAMSWNARWNVLVRNRSRGQAIIRLVVQLVFESS